MKIKARLEEVIIGALVGGGVGYACASVIMAFARFSLPSIDPIVISNQAVSWIKMGQVLIALSGPIFALIGGWIATQQAAETHLAGTQYLGDELAAIAAFQRAEKARWSTDQRARKLRGMTIGGVELARQTEVSHAMFVALPNSGKSALLTHVLSSVLARGDRAIVHDPKGEFVEKFAGESTVLLGPWDARSAIWSTTDIDSPALADEFASALCGDTSAAGQNRYFHTAAAAVLSGAIKEYMRSGEGWAWADLSDRLRGKTPDLLIDAARGDERVAPLFGTIFAGENIPKNPRLSGAEKSVLATLASASKLIHQLAAVDLARPMALRFSLRRWLLGEDHNDIKLLILNSSAEYPTAQEAIFGAMLTAIHATIASGAMPDIDPDQQGIWMLLDELPQLGPVALKKLQSTAELGRSRGIRVWSALQDESQLNAVMGHEKAEPIKNMQGIKGYMRASPSGAATISKRYGDRELIRIENTVSSGAVAGKTARKTTGKVIQASELTGLKITQTGPEMVLGIGPTLGKIIQPFDLRLPSIASPYMPCPAWRAGRPPAPAPTTAQEPEPVGETDESPFGAWDED